MNQQSTFLFDDLVAQQEAAMEVGTLIYDISSRGVTQVMWARYGAYFPLVLQIKIIVESVREHRANADAIAFVRTLPSNPMFADLDPKLLSLIRGRILNLHFRGEHPAYSKYGRFESGT